MVQMQGKRKGKKTAEVKAKKQVKPPPPKEESSEEEEEVESEEEVAPKVVAKKPTKKASKAKAKAKEESEEEDEEEDSEEEEVVKKSSNGNSAKAESDDDDDDDEEEEDDEDDDEEEEEESEEEETVKPKKGKAKAETMEVDDDDDEEDDDEEEEDDDDEEEDDEEEEETEPAKGKKRKQENAGEGDAKKAKTEGEIITVLFTNLPEGTDDNTFNSFLKKKGIQCKACRANYNRCKAFVDIDSSDKDKALGLCQVEWKGSELSVEEAERKGERGDGSRDRDNSDRDARTMFVKNLPYHASEDDLMGLFENVEEVRLLSDRDTGRSKGIAFVQFNDAAGLDKAMESKDEYELEGRQLLVDYTDSRSQRSARGGNQGGRGGRGGRGGGQGGSAPSKTLFVKGVTEDMSRDDLAKYFEDASDVRMITDKETGKNKFFAYIEFNDEQAAKKCYQSAKGGIEGDDTTFYVDFARERGNDRNSGGFGGRRGGGGFRGRGGRGGGGFRGRGGRGGGGFRGRGGGFRGRGDGGKKTTFNDSD